MEYDSLIADFELIDAFISQKWSYKVNFAWQIDYFQVKWPFFNIYQANFDINQPVCNYLTINGPFLIKNEPI